MDADVVFINVILLATLAFNMPPMHSICHLRIFCYCVDGRDHFINDFKKIKDWPKSKISLGTKSRNDPKCRDQKFIYAYIDLFDVISWIFFANDGRDMSIQQKSGQPFEILWRRKCLRNINLGIIVLFETLYLYLYMCNFLILNYLICLSWYITF